MGIYQRILVATDLSEENYPTVNRAQQLSHALNATLDIVHVVEPLPGYGYAYVGAADIEAQLIEEAKAAMIKLGEKFAIPKDRQWLEVGSTKLQILQIAKNLNADLIITGSHGRHGIAELIGSAAHALIHGALCDVLTIRIAAKE